MIKKIIIYLVAFIIIISIWEYYGKHSTNARLLISSPSLISQYIIDNFNSLSTAMFTTFLESFLGLILAVVFSFITMIICLLFPKVLDILLPVFISSQVVPLIALAPLLILIFGLGLQAKIVMAALMCFFPLFINFLSGIRAIPTTIKELLFVYNASSYFKIFRISFPLSLPHIFTGLKISATLSVIGAIVAEFNGADVGLGKNLFLSAKRLEPELLMSSLLLSIILGGLMYLLIWAIENRIGKWYLT